MEPAKSAQLALPELPDPEAAPAPELSDAEFVLRTFGVNPAKYMRPCEPGEVAEDGAATYLEMADASNNLVAAVKD